MTRVAIIGGGRAATVHAEAARAASNVELVGVGGRPEPGTAGVLAEAVEVPDQPIATLIAAADAVVIAVPPRDVASVLAHVPVDMPVMIEAPIGIHERIAHHDVVGAANLLHAPVVKRALRSIAELGPVHHLMLRARATRRDWGVHGTTAFGGGVILDPGATLLPVLMAAAGSPVAAVRATMTVDDGLDTASRISLELVDGRTAVADLAWTDPPIEAEVEAAGERGVVTLRLWPQPTLELDGTPVALPVEPPIVALGFVEQIRRFASIVANQGTPWPPVAVGEGVMAIAEAAAESARRSGALVQCPPRAERDPATVLLDAAEET